MKVKNILTIAKLTLAGIIAFSSACSQVKAPGTTTQKEEEKKLAEYLAKQGLLHFQAGKHDKAIEDLTKAIKLNPDNADYYFIRGLAYKLMGLHDKAEQDYKKAQEMKK